MVVSLFPSFSNSWGRTKVGDMVKLKKQNKTQQQKPKPSAFRGN
jgi:hypothetical protein